MRLPSDGASTKLFLGKFTHFRGIGTSQSRLAVHKKADAESQGQKIRFGAAGPFSRFSFRKKQRASNYGFFSFFLKVFGGDRGTFFKGCHPQG